MPDPVKISDLPAISSVQPNDIIPIVDSALTQTSKATAAQICAVGGGPPGDGTVTASKVANGAVTASKHGFTGPNLLVSRILSGAGEGVEIPCTGYARGLLATSDSAGALSYLGGLQSANNPTFTGDATFNGTISATGSVTSNAKFISSAGTAASPSYSFIGDTNCGIAQLGGADTISLVTAGVERWRVDSTGAYSSTIPGGSTLYPHFMCRAWANFNGAAGGTRRGSGNVSSVTRTTDGTNPIYYINFATAMPDANYCVVLGNEFVFGQPYNMARLYYPGSGQLTTSVAVFIDGPSVPLPDRSFISVAIFR